MPSMPSHTPRPSLASRLARAAWAGLSALTAVGILTLTLGGCNSTEANDPPASNADTTIQVISPIGGSFKLSAPMRIIVKCDYSKFSSGLNYQLSSDSSKSWHLMKANVKKDGIALDTLDWDPVNDPPGDVPAGKPLLFRVIDYDKKHFAISAYFTLTP